jgi:peptidyl-prolyl cis-trans isomerase B (cyclophilin B)
MKDNVFTVIAVFLGVLCLVFIGLYFWEVKSDEPAPPDQVEKQRREDVVKILQKDPKDMTYAEMKKTIAVIKTKLGVVKFKFYPEKAPETCRNFIRLAKSGFYNNLYFHRIAKDFMIQGGDPKGNGQGGPGYSIKAEFNDIKHVPGIVSMARSNDPDSAGSQFFICQGKPSSFLDGKYTAFGQVIEGLNIVDSIANAPVAKGTERPENPVVMESVTIE